MAHSRGIILGSILACVLLDTSPAAAQKKYDPGVSDTEIKLGNIMPYSGPLSAYALIGRTQDAFFKRLNAEAASTDERSTSSLMTTVSARQRQWSKRASSWRAMRCC